MPHLFGLSIRLAALLGRLCLSLLLACVGLAWLTTASAGILQSSTNGTVTDPATGLVWMRCAMGQTWTGSTCSGTATTYTFDQANALTGTITFAGQSDWRMPNIRELQTINSTAFPSTTSSYFWTGSPVAGSSSLAWGIYLGDGYAHNYNRSSGYAVRLVRGGQSVGPSLSLARPSGDYTDNGNGTVTHKPTNLTWMRCAMGQTWTGTTCSGTVNTYTSDQAKALIGLTAFAGYSDWRVPTSEELLSLVDYTIAYPSPTINTSMFPATPSSDFWSVSFNGSYSAWNVVFYYGYTGSSYGSNVVRLVRGGSSPVTSDSTAPSVPGGLAASAAGTSQINLSWSAATDNVGVTAYKVYRKGALLTTLGNVTSYSDTVLDASTSYSYTVQACDAAGNCSAQSAAASATSAAIASTSTLQPSTDGTVTDPVTGLVWMRCAMGQTWTGRTCSGTATAYTFDKANALTGTGTFAGQSDWRIPNIRELQALVERLTYNPAINSTAFPNTPSSYFWSGSPNAYSSYYAWNVYFFYGYANSNGLSGSYAARLVRGGQSFSTSDSTAPSVPGGLAASVEGTSQVNLSWSAATDNVGVTAYKVYRNDALLATLGNATSYSDMGVSASTSYSYTVQACDATGNCSAQSAAASATTAVSTGTPTLQPNADGTVTDPATGLVWMRCAVGQTWTGSTCSGTAATYTFDKANALTGTVTFAGQSDWRMPNIRELQTIVDRSTYHPAINGIAFPNTPSSSFWSGAPNADYSNSFAWYVSFEDGLANNNAFWSNGGAVRLVRGGKSFGSLLSVTRPTGDYVENGDGTVTHKPTNLTWMRCAMGQTWTGNTCSGTAKTYTFDAANALTGTTTFAGYNDWHLPTEEELVSLVDYTLMINTSMFPATPRSFFWSVLPTIGYSGRAWDVDFYNGGIGRYDDRSNSYAVRLVRGGQSAATTTPVCTLSATPVVIAAGSSATLTANCNPVATSYVWTNSGFNGTTVSGTVSPTAPTLYSVTGRNAAGSGNTATAAVYVCNTAPGGGSPGLTLGGTAGNDQLASGMGNDAIDGVAGIDTVIYNCNRSSFVVTKTESGWKVSSTAEGLDTLTNVERIRFSDETLALDLDGNAGRGYRIYQAAFNRKPDVGGLKYWIGQLDAGMDQREVAARFIDSNEFRTLYGNNPSNADFLTKVYTNVLHRTPDQGGYDWWLGELNAGRYDKAWVLASFAESPENQAGVLQAILNGIDLPD